MNVLLLKRIRLAAVFALVLLLALVALTLAEKTQGMAVHFFDVGQGDAALVSLPNNVQVLVDGGPSDRVVAKLGEYMPFYDRTIEYVILSHPHYDHFAGLIPVLERYKVGTFIHNGVTRDLPQYQRLIELVNRSAGAVLVVTKPQVIELSNDASLNFLYPVAAFSEEGKEDVNATSIVNTVRYGNTAVLFTGDAPMEVELELVSRYELAADVLKVGHQGSKTSSAEAFLQEVNPRFAVIMVGENEYGHPHARTLNTFKRLTIPVFRTDELGDITIVSDGSVMRRSGK